MKIRLIHLANSTANSHDYYCHDLNYYSNDAHQRYGTWEEFYAEYKNADVDMNLCFRWDVEEIMLGEDEEKPTGRYRMKIYIIQQRKGKFIPVEIGSILEENVDEIFNYLTIHWEKLNLIWKPLSPE